MIETSASLHRHNLSQHARIRSQQRAIRPSLLAYVLEHCDTEMDAGGRCRALRICSRYQEPCADVHEYKLVERAKRIRVIENADGRIVTVKWAWGRRRGWCAGRSDQRTRRASTSVLHEIRVATGDGWDDRYSE
jgi:hypothetical protein